MVIPAKNLLDSRDTEQFVLSCMLKSEQSSLSAIKRLKPDDFASEDCRELFNIISDCVIKNLPTEPSYLINSLKHTGKVNLSLSLDSILKLGDMAINASNVNHYIDSLLDYSNRRKLKDIAVSMAEMAEKKPAIEVVRTASSLIDTISARTQLAELRMTSDDVMEMIRYRKEHGYVNEIPYGYKSIDDFTGGIQRGQFIVVGARTSMGKSSFIQGIAMNVAEQDKPVLYCSSETKYSGIELRRLSILTGIDSKRIRRGLITDEELEQIEGARISSSDYPLEIYDDNVITCSNIRVQAKAVKAKYGDVALIVMDYVQQMQERGKDMREQIVHATRGLKSIAMELNCGVIGVSQIGRASESRGNKRPTLSDLKESGSFEEDADIVMLLHREEYYQLLKGVLPENIAPEIKDRADIIIAKGRDDGTTTIPMRFLASCTTFIDRKKEK